MSALFSSFELSGLKLSNRIVVAPMCQYSAEKGCATDWHLIHLGQLAFSGAGLVILEATAVSPEGRITESDLGLWDDQTERALGRVLESVRNYSDTPLAIQIAHAGRKASSQAPWDGGQLIPPGGPGGWQTIAPSAIPHGPAELPPHAMDQADLKRIREAFVATAQRAARLGFEAIELHAAHGYLLHEFLSPLSNQRTDEYGGTLANRLRFPLEIFDAVRQSVPAQIPVGMRLSASDWVEGGWDLAQSIELGHALDQAGTSFIHVSSGGLSPLQKIPQQPGYQIPFAHALKQACTAPIIGVGLITKPAQAEAIIAQGEADLVALARGILFDPRWPWHAAAELGGQVNVPRQYWRSQPSEHKHLFGNIKIGQR